MKKLSIVTGLIFLIACNKGVWVTQNVYRPRRAKFAILKEPFKGNSLINNKFFYVSTKKFINYDGKRIYSLTGFYPDGRLIGCSFDEDELTTIEKSNSWNTAFNIGYYSTLGSELKLEYFTQGDGGRYVQQEGLIRKDTIVMVEKINMFVKKEIRFDTLVVSTYPFKE